MLSHYKNCNLKLFISIFLVIVSVSGCKKLVDIQPPITSVSEENAFASDANAVSVLTNIYISMNTNLTGGGGGGTITTNAGMSSDEFDLFNATTGDPRYYYYTNALNPNGQPPAGGELWGLLYNSNFIFPCNAAIEGITASSSLTASVKQQLLGEAKFMRAFCYFYLVNLYGDVPLVLSTNWQQNLTLSRTPKAQVYQQIIMDLKEAQTLLSPNYLNQNLQQYSGTPERVRPTQGAAMALLARVYLYTGDYSDAEDLSGKVISNSGQYSLTLLNDAFLANSSESIWQLQPTLFGHNTEDGWAFILPSTGPDGLSWPVSLNRNLVNSFESGDQRRLDWVDSVIVAPDTFYFPFKYKSATLNAPVTEYTMVLRLAEQYLIRAEARAQQGETNALDDLNAIRNRAGLPNYAGLTDKNSILTAILHERQVELFTEWGHRWLDLKRTGNVDAVMTIVTPQKSGGAPWNSYQQLYPLPVSDILQDQNLVQNPGY